MATGKSLELAAIKSPSSSPRCKCGVAYADHLRKDGQVLARYDNPKHGLVENLPLMGMSRASRRRMMRQARRG